MHCERIQLFGPGVKRFHPDFVGNVDEGGVEQIVVMAVDYADEPVGDFGVIVTPKPLLVSGSHLVSLVGQRSVFR